MYFNFSLKLDSFILTDDCRIFKKIPFDTKFYMI